MRNTNNMAFNLTPGREKFPSTGNGLPNEFKQNNEPPLQIAVTNKFNAGVDKYKKELVNTNQGRSDINVNLNTAEATANEFKRDVVTKGGYTTITGSGGLIFRGRTGMKATEDAVKASAKKVDDVNSRRANNANAFNLFAGVKEPSAYTEEDKKALIQTGKALKV